MQLSTSPNLNIDNRRRQAEFGYYFIPLLAERQRSSLGWKQRLKQFQAGTQTPTCGKIESGR